MTTLSKSIQKSIELRKKIFFLKKDIDKSINIIFKTIKSNKKILVCGNGGSAAEAQHFAAEFLIRLNPKINRKSFPMIALALDTSTITACGNDFSFDEIFSRNLEGIGVNGDLLLCLSTSGNSKNIINVLKKAKLKKINSLSILGNGGGKAKKISNHNIIIPSSDTALIQEEHLFLGHYILNEVEKKLLK
jgi:D-sedoheptulose 7-phosphate isomerase